MLVTITPAQLCAIALGQLCAIGLHAWTWRLRQRAIWSLAVVGLLGAGLFVLVMAAWLTFVVTPLLQEKSFAKVTEYGVPLGSLLFISIVPLAVGFLHAWQLRGRWKPTCDGWGNATLSVFGEISLGCLAILGLSGVVSPINYGSFFVNCAFWATLLVLMLLRPLVLKFLRPLKPMLKNVRENVWHLHSKVLGDV